MKTLLIFLTCLIACPVLAQSAVKGGGDVDIAPITPDPLGLRVGINTTAPSGTLHITGEASSTKPLFFTVDSNMPINAGKMFYGGFKFYNRAGWKELFAPTFDMRPSLSGVGHYLPGNGTLLEVGDTMNGHNSSVGLTIQAWGAYGLNFPAFQAIGGGQAADNTGTATILLLKDGSFLDRHAFEADGDARHRGALRVNDQNMTRPTCVVAQRGKLWFTEGGSSVADSMEVCAKDAAGAYAWRALY